MTCGCRRRRLARAGSRIYDTSIADGVGSGGLTHELCTVNADDQPADAGRLVFNGRKTRMHRLKPLTYQLELGSDVVATIGDAGDRWEWNGPGGQLRVERARRLSLVRKAMMLASMGPRAFDRRFGATGAPKGRWLDEPRPDRGWVVRDTAGEQHALVAAPGTAHSKCWAVLPARPNSDAMLAGMCTVYFTATNTIL